MNHVFISYSRKDAEFVNLLVEELREYSHEVWFDKSDIRGGTEWGTEIKNAVDSSYAVIVVVSTDSNRSKWVSMEVELAKITKKNNKVPIIPIKIDKEKIPSSLASYHAIDFSSMFEGSDIDSIRHYRSGVQQLLKALELARPILRFLKELKHSNAEKREEAAHKLGELEDMGSAVQLINALKDLDSDVRYEAALSLGKLKVVNAYKPLVRLLKDEVPDVCAAAATALGELGLTEAIGPIGLQLKNPDRYVRASVARALGKLGNVSSVNVLVELLRTDGISDVREAAKEALENIGGRQAERALSRIKQINLLGRKK